MDVECLKKINCDQGAIRAVRFNGKLRMIDMILILLLIIMNLRF